MGTESIPATADIFKVFSQAVNELNMIASKYRTYEQDWDVLPEEFKQRIKAQIDERARTAKTQLDEVLLAIMQR